ASGIYALVRLAEPQQNRIVALAGLLSIPVGGALLAAVQLLAGAQATQETVRALPLPIWFAGSFSLPPENLVTLLAPDFFGDFSRHAYWGRWYLWEACLFFGVTGLALASYGIWAARATGQRALLITLAVTLVLAFGQYSPLYRILYDWVPLYDRFRGSAKFTFLAALMLALFAGYGLDRILRDRSVSPRAIMVAAAGAAALVICGAVVSNVDWGPVMKAMQATGQTYLAPASYSDSAFVSESQAFAATGLFVAGLTLAAGVLLALRTRREPRAAFIIGTLAIAEVFVFARMHRPTVDSAQVVIPQLSAYLAAHPGDYRTLNTWMPDSAMSMGTFDAWGYDPGVTRRYAELMAWIEGENPDTATQYMSLRRFGPLLTMLRVKYVVTLQNNTMRMFPGIRPPLDRLVLVGAYQVHAQRDSILRAMGAASFDPAKEVILEQPPDPAPVLVGEVHGRAAIVREGTDFMDIEADVQNPALLLVTDAWADGWRAVPLEGSSQSRYRLVPADYALRAVALGRGHHHLRIEYAPRLFYVGAILSALAWPAWILALVLLGRRKERRHA
ncbi:MAG: hypothetical protein WCA17_12425, partial [Burkholderiales bacterium]